MTQAPWKPHPDAPPEPDELGELSDDAIAGPLRILQRLRGHRYSLDDVLTAWEAARTLPAAERCLELGSGIGSVLLMLAYKLPHARFVAVEAQRNSFSLLGRNVARNDLTGRIELIHGDLRNEVTAARFPDGFSLITGTPPYVPPGKATPSTDAQRAYARQEYRGGVEAYVEAASRVLAPRGRFVVCADARAPERVEQAACACNLTVLRRRDVIPREALKGALFSVFTLARADEIGGTECEVSSWFARDARGARTEDYREVRAFFDMPSTEEAPSP